MAILTRCVPGAHLICKHWPCKHLQAVAHALIYNSTASPLTQTNTNCHCKHFKQWHMHIAQISAIPNANQVSIHCHAALVIGRLLINSRIWSNKQSSTWRHKQTMKQKKQGCFAFAVWVAFSCIDTIVVTHVQWMLWLTLWRGLSEKSESYG